jgi:L-threonylcarbamoyladenylate synthase
MLEEINQNEVIQLFENDGIALLPTDTIWGLCCHAESQVAIHRIMKLKQSSPGQGMVALVSDMAMMKRYFQRLHPRLETLLMLHQRPLTILSDEVTGMDALLEGPGGQWAMRIVKDRKLQSIIRALDAPIVATSPCLQGDEPPAYFGLIPSDFLQQVDYIAPNLRIDKTPKEPSVMVALDQREELLFVRE